MARRKRVRRLLIAPRIGRVLSRVQTTLSSQLLHAYDRLGGIWLHTARQRTESASPLSHASWTHALLKQTLPDAWHSATCVASHLPRGGTYHPACSDNPAHTVKWVPEHLHPALRLQPPCSGLFSGRYCRVMQ